MSIFLLILKIIGIAILCIISFILVVLLLVLFVPIRYRIFVDKPENDDFSAKVTITWLLHFVNMHAKYTDDLYYRLRILIFSIIKSDNLKKKRTNKIQNKKDTSDTKKNNELDIDNNTTNDIDNLVSSNYVEDADNNISDKTYDEDDNTKKTIFEKITFIIEKIIEFIFNFKSKIIGIVNKIKSIIEDIDYYIDVANDEKNKEIFSLCYKQLSKVLKNIKPKIIRGHAYIGLDDPYSMGQMLSIYGILFPLIHDKIQLVPDYDREIMAGDLYIKGRITLFIIICAGIKIYFNRDFRKMLKVLKKEGI